jgi:hypothetical protein
VTATSVDFASLRALRGTFAAWTLALATRALLACSPEADPHPLPEPAPASADSSASEATDHFIAAR